MIGSRGDGWTLVAGGGGGEAFAFVQRPLHGRGKGPGAWGPGDWLRHIPPDQAKCTLSQWGNFSSRPRPNRKSSFFLSSLRAVVWKAERREDEREAIEFVHLVLDL